MDFFHRSKEIFENPYIVAKIQKFFGVTYKSNILKVTSKEAQNQEETTAFQRKKSVQNPCTYYKIEENDSQPNEPSPWTEDTQSSDASKESTDAKNAKNYVVENKFWYFFFLFGTYLGDEVGYAVSIPFLLWNIDAVVARKLVLVWTIVMYIGEIFERLFIEMNFQKMEICLFVSFFLGTITRRFEGIKCYIRYRILRFEYFHNDLSMCYFLSFILLKIWFSKHRICS